MTDTKEKTMQLQPIVDPAYPGWPGPGFRKLDLNLPSADRFLVMKAQEICIKMGKISCSFTHRGEDGTAYMAVYDGSKTARVIDSIR